MSEQSERISRFLRSEATKGSYYERAKRANIKVLEERSDERFLL